MKARMFRFAAFFSLLAAFILSLPTRIVLGQSASPPPSPAGSQTVASSGLLPIYGVELQPDKAWIDGGQFPSQSQAFPNFGVSASFQQLWDTLKAGGLNLLRLRVDVSDLPASANQAANLCIWARNYNVKLMLVLHVADGLGQDYDSRAAGFVKTLAGMLRADEYQTAYTQIAGYELEPDLNNPSFVRRLGARAGAQDLLLKAPQSVRNAENDALHGTTVGATPIMVSASFDYELIRANAIAGVSLDDAAYDGASSRIIEWLKPLAASPNIDIISVSWFPGSISAGGVDKPPALLRSLAAIVPDKQLLFTTGFSTAFHTADEQKQYYTMAFANLADLHASANAATPFAGVIFRQALNGHASAPPNQALPQAVSTWNLRSKAAELSAMWTANKRSDEMDWWVNTVYLNMGLVDNSNAAMLSPKAALQTMAGINSAVGSATTNPTTTAATGGPSGAAASPGPGKKSIVSSLGQTVENKAEQSLSGLLDSVFQRMGSMVQSVGTGGGGGNFGYAGASGGFNMPPTGDTTSASGAATSAASSLSTTGAPPAAAIPATSPVQVGIAKQDVTFQPPSPRVGQPVTITAKLNNQGSVDAVGISVLASGAGNAVLAETDSVRVPANSVSPVTLQWIPKDNKPASIVLRVSDGSGTEIANVSLDPVNVSAAGSPASSPGSPAPNNAPAQANTAMTAGSSGDSSSATAVVPAGFAKIGDIVLQRNLVAGQAGSLTLPVSNPLLVPINNLRATLMIDGQTVQTQTVPILMSQQDRSIVFSNVVIAQAGIHEVKIGVQLQRANARPQMGLVSQTIRVDPPTAVVSVAKATMNGSRGNAGSKPGSTTSPQSQVRMLVPGAIPPASPAGSPRGDASASKVAGSVRLSLSAQDLSYEPVPARPAQSVSFRVLVRNSGDAPAQRATLILSLFADGKLVRSTEPPIQFSVGARGTYQATWQAPMPAGSQITLVASATADNNAAGAVEATIALKASASVVGKPSGAAAPPAKHP